MLQRSLILSYSALVLLQPLWWWWLPPPAGPQSPMLGAIALLLLLPALPGVWRGQKRARVWAAYASLPFFVLGVMEWWANDAGRLLAMAQALLPVLYWILLITVARRSAAPPSSR